MSQEEDDNTVNEPVSFYEAGKKLSDVFPGIHISSLEQQAELTRQYSASLSPVERMAYLHQLILIAYAEELKKPVEELWNKQIVIEEVKW